MVRKRKTVDVVITSPPYVDGLHDSREKRATGVWKNSELDVKKNLPMGYSESQDNIGNKKYGNIDLIVTSPPYCYDAETEILTDTGWKYFEDLSLNDLVMSLNLHNGKGNYVKPLNLYSNDYEGWMYTHKTRRHSFSVTPNHKMLFRNHRNGSEFMLRSIEELNSLKSKVYLKSKFLWDGTHQEQFVLPQYNYYRGSKIQKIDQKIIPMSYWLEFLGWYLAEGSARLDGHSSDVRITQKKYVVDVERALKNIGFHVSKFENKKKRGIFEFGISSVQLTNWVLENCYFSKEKTSYTKKVPDFIKKLTPELIEVFLSSYWKGDGSSLNPSKNGRQFRTYSKHLADDVQILELLSGKSARVYGVDGKCYHNGNRAICYFIWERARNTCLADHFKIEKKWYKGKVGCVEVPSHIILVRRDGDPMFCGNSEGIGHERGKNASHDHPERLKMQDRYTKSMRSKGNISKLKYKE